MNNLMLSAYIAGNQKISEIRRFFNDDERGVTAVEYAIVLAGVAAVVAVIFGKGGTVDGLLKDIFSDVQSQVKSSMTSS